MKPINKRKSALPFFVVGHLPSSPPSPRIDVDDVSGLTHEPKDIIHPKLLGIHRSAVPGGTRTVPGGSLLTTKGPKYVTHHETACSRGQKDSTRIAATP